MLSCLFVRLGKNRKGENQPPMRSITVDVLGSSPNDKWLVTRMSSEERLCPFLVGRVKFL